MSLIADARTYTIEAAASDDIAIFLKSIPGIKSAFYAQHASVLPYQHFIVIDIWMAM